MCGTQALTESLLICQWQTLPVQQAANAGAQRLQ